MNDTKRILVTASCSLACLLSTLPVSGGEPRVLVEGCHLSLLAQEPEVVTPIGMAFDAQGRLLFVESHTHQRPDGYEGPESDCVRLVEDTDGDGRLDQWSTFADGYRHAMNVAIHPDGGVYVVTRMGVHLLHDTDGDGHAEDDQTIVFLETNQDYPHNALSGICHQGERMYLGVGENMGSDYSIVGSDGVRIPNTGGVGTIYACQWDGSRLERFAEGFWNPFSLCNADGALVCVDNDPDASPPCRLINVCPQGDYGFRYEYGRAGVHPLHAWNGELPGTLPMVCGTGEAPTAVVCHRGYVWVTSWGDHRIERYRILPQRGGTQTAERTVVVQGDADFRPTGMAVAPDGSLYFADWVLRNYPVHGRGRIWRLDIPTEMQNDKSIPRATWTKKMPSHLRELVQARWHQAEHSAAEVAALIRSALADKDPDVRLYAVRWAAERRLTALIEPLEQLLSASPPDKRYYLAVLAALDWLQNPGEQRHSGLSDGLLMRELRNPDRNAACRGLALRLISPNYEQLTLELLKGFAESQDSAVREAAVACLCDRQDPARLGQLREIVQDESRGAAERADALVGLAADVPQFEALFQDLAAGDEPTLAAEARRTLRLRGYTPPPEEEHPPTDDLPAWFVRLEGAGDPAAGRRLFFHPAGPQCSKCHQFGGRGGDIGPDLTAIGKSSSREAVITSILLPSREIAPRFQPWILTTDAGRSYLGLRLPQGGDDGQEPYADSAGETFVLPSAEIETRLPADTSLMPAGLEKNLTVEDLRDLVTFLAGRSEKVSD